MNTAKKLMLVMRGSGDGGTPPFSDDFNRANGPIGGDWTGATWTIVSNAAINTPSVGPELVTNGTFNTDIANWVDVSSGAGTISWDATGKMALNTVNPSGNRGHGSQALAVENGQFYALSSVGSATINHQIGTTATGSQIVVSSTTSPNMDFPATATTIYANFQNGTTGTQTVDDITCKLMGGIFATVTLTAGNSYAECAATVATSQNAQLAGIVHYVDDDNYVVGYLFRGQFASRLHLAKRVAGTTTLLANVAATYSAGALIRLTRSGTDYSVAYNGSTLINATAVADAAFTTANQWGMFGGQGVSFDSFAWAAA